MGAFADVAGWESDDGSKDWAHRAEVARMLFLMTTPSSFRHRIRLFESTQQIFRYLACYFLDFDPIKDPRAKKPATSANEAERVGAATEHAQNSRNTSKHGRNSRRHKSHKNGITELRNSPTSESAATEKLASAKQDKEDLSTTQDLTQGTEDVDNGNVRCTEDPCTSLEALAQGISAKCAETTSVVLEGTPHETQDRLQNSLPLTPRPPIEGEPSRCKQEAADSVVTAGRTNGMVRMTKPPQNDADIDRTPMLGEEPATRDCGVDEGDGMERDGTQLQQTNLLCGGIIQRNENANANVPSAYKLPLEGEWTGYASGKSNESKGCSGGMGERASVDEADGNPGHGIEPTDAPNELTEFVGLLVESYVENSSDTPRVCLGGTCWRACNVEGLGCQADRSRGQADALRGQADALNASNRAETNVISHDKEMTDGVGCHADTSTEQTDAPCVETDAITAADTPQIVRIPRRKKKPPNSPMDATRTAPDGPNGIGDHADRSSVPTDVHSIGNKRETAENETETIRTCRIKRKMENSPYKRENETPEPTNRWRKVSVSNVDVYVPCNAPIEAPGQTLAFGEPESGGEAIAPIVEGERAGDGGGDRNGGDGDDGGDGDEGGTTSSGSVDSV